MSLRATFFFETPPPTGKAGAIALVRLQGDVSAALSALGSRDAPVGQARLRTVAGVDEALVMRWSEGDATISVHAGPAVVRALRDALLRAGAQPLTQPEPGAIFPHARDGFEALALAALSRAASPAAVDLLLDQPARWRAWDGGAPALEEIRRVSAQLNHLLDPPVVAAVGAVNVGKSTLLNALAGRTVSIVSAEPGATRDHVGARLALSTSTLVEDGAGGLVVRWVDAPGLRLGGAKADALERAAASAARRALAQAAIVVVCSDGAAPFPDAAALASIGVGSAGLTPALVRLRTKADLPGADPPQTDLAVCALTGQGLENLAGTLSALLVSPAALRWSGPWLFDERLLRLAEERTNAGVASCADQT